MNMLIRLALLLIALLSIAGLAVFFRRIGLGEWGILLAVLAWVIGVESVRYIALRFLRAYRHGPTQRTKR